MTGTAVAVRGLRKHYGTAKAVDGLDFDVAEGEVFGFLGPNGAGKSTTINMLCTLLAPTDGTAMVSGCDVVADQDAVRRAIGLVFQDSVLDGYLTAVQNLRFHADLYGIPRGLVRGRVDEVLDMVGLTERGYDTVATFSGGMKRRLEIARGLLHRPRVLFLDEPTAGLDPQSRRAIWDYVTELRDVAGITVFMTTHYLEEAEYCDRIAIIDHGALVVTGTPDTLKSGIGQDTVRLSTDDERDVADALRDRFGVVAELVDGEVVFTVPDGAWFVPRLLAEVPVAVTSVSVRRPSLDDVFLSHTGTTIRSGS